MYIFFISTLSCFLELIVTVLIEYILGWTYSKGRDEKLLRKELINIKGEISKISMVDEFSKYAKLQRKYNKLEDNLKIIANARLSSRRKVQLIIVQVIRAINVSILSILLYLYRSEPVVILPSGMLSPLENWLKWPGKYTDGISLTLWIIITRLAFSSLIPIISSKVKLDNNNR